MKTLKSPEGTELYYTGEDADHGPLPAFFYFALCKEESLTLEPYNHPVLPFKETPCRVFSVSIPGHGDGHDKFLAIDYWAEQMAKGTYILEPFFEEVAQVITWLVETDVIDPNRLAFGGLSRGAFVATHIAARQPHVQTLVGFAPLVDLRQSASFTPYPELNQWLQTLDLHTLIPKLDHLKNFRFYMGLNDTLVNTDTCYSFIREFACHAETERLRALTVELMLRPSIGYKGHGTPPEVFEAGAHFVQHHLSIKST